MLTFKRMGSICGFSKFVKNGCGKHIFLHNTNILHMCSVDSKVAYLSFNVFGAVEEI